jgi:hypothetical protein
VEGVCEGLISGIETLSILLSEFGFFDGGFIGDDDDLIIFVSGDQLFSFVFEVTFVLEV